MAAAPPIPDGEKILHRYLSADTDITALGARVVGQTPRSDTEPWVRITQLDAAAAPESPAEHLIAYLLQFDCYAGADGVGGSQQAGASLLARTVRAALHVMPDQDIDEAVVTSVRFQGMPRLPDPGFEPARERYALTALIHMHPIPGS